MTAAWEHVGSEWLPADDTPIAGIGIPFMGVPGTTVAEPYGFVHLVGNVGLMPITVAGPDGTSRLLLMPVSLSAEQEADMVAYIRETAVKEAAMYRRAQDRPDATEFERRQEAALQAAGLTMWKRGPGGEKVPVPFTETWVYPQPKTHPAPGPSKEPGLWTTVGAMGDEGEDD